MSKISMMFQIVCLLQTNYIISGTELADLLETSPRNIKAYIEALRMAGVPIVGLSGRRGGYFLSDMYEFKPPKLNDEEYSALLLAEEILTRENGFHYEREIKTAFAKIKAVQGEIIGNSETIAEDEYIFTRGNMDISPQVKSYLTLIRQAILDKNRIRIIHYNPIRKQATERTVNPYNLIYRNSSWYVIGHCHLRDKVRMFKLMRIRIIEVLEQSFHISPDFFIKTYMRNTFNLINPGKEYNVEVLFFHPASTWVSEKLWLPTQKVVWLDDDSMIFSAKVNGLTDIKKWVLGYGKLAKVLEPQELVDKVKSEVEEMGRRY